MKRQQSALLSSSSSYRERNGRAESSKDLQGKGVGCMSGFFHIVFKYQNKRKSLTYGKKHENIIAVPVTVAEPPRATAAVPEKAGSISDAKSTNCDKRCRVMDHEMPRSPTIQPEIRLHSGSLSSPRAVTSPLTLPGTLMGLSCEADGEEAKGASETAAEKRRKLLGALEKCDEDLKALKRTIDVVMQSEVGDRKLVGEESPSPLLVLDWPRISSEKNIRSSIDIAKAKAHQLRKKRGGTDQEDTSATNGTPCHSIRLLERITNEPFSAASRLSNRDKLAVAAAGTSTSSRPSKAMTESVEQVCRDVTLGERREAGRIGVALHDHICRELIEETIHEMGSSGQSDRGQLPFEACRRRLVF
ncbi:hypothetical protein MLD38_020101 [Melastoma candidum]|uniref:Uncharacterized protein n=1 Tax=Melastoma candidum TaxID=119954 RepID=A0ACB9QC61_9MYRT|nr:hypothetical protein MLD38_020101 [Melastoma candidum]